MLMSVINFIDDNGNFILNDPQTLYIQGDNGQGSLEVSKGLTLGQLTERILGAMTTDQLGHGLGFEGSATEFASEGEHAGQIKVTSGIHEPATPPKMDWKSKAFSKIRANIAGMF